MVELLYVVVVGALALVSAQNTPGNPRDCRIDLLILVDRSGSIVSDRQYDLGRSYLQDQEIMKNWYEVTNFTNNIISALNISETQTHVALVTFEDRIRTIFPLSEYSKSVMYDSVRMLANRIPDGQTNAFGALKTARDDIFSIGGVGNRPEVDDVIILITDGAPTASYGGPEAILQEAAGLKGRGFTILCVGVTDKVNATLLQLIVSDPARQYFPVDNFQGLGNQLGSIINKSCDERPVEQFSVDCNVDLAFVMDSSGSDRDQNLQQNWDQVIDFTIRIARSYFWNSTDVRNLPRIAAVSMTTQPVLEFDLNSYRNKDDYFSALSAISYIGGEGNITAALELVYNQVFTSQGGDRVGVQNVIVLITDGRDMIMTGLNAIAEMLKSTGVHIIVLYVHSSPAPQIYSDLVTDPTKDLLNVKEYNQMSTVYRNCTQLSCDKVSSSCKNRLDVCFVMDTSGSIGTKNYRYMRNFVASVIDDLVAETNDVRVCLVTFSTDVQPIISLGTFSNKSEILDAVLNVPYRHGTTNTAEAINYLRSTAFTPGRGDREDVPNIALILTDGNSNDKSQTLKEAYQARKVGIHLITVGIGGWTNKFELQSVASYPYQDNYFPINSFSELNNTLRRQLNNIICGDMKTCSSNPCQCGGTCVPYIGGYVCECPQGCAGANCEISCDLPKDIVVAVDSSGTVGETNLQRQLDFVRELVLRLNFNTGTQLGLLKYSKLPEVRFHLNEFGSGAMTKIKLLNAISLYYERGTTNTAGALRVMHTEMFTPGNGDEEDHPNVGIVITDGRSISFDATWDEARMARDKGIELLAIAIGNSVNYLELESIASGPDSTNIYKVSNFDTLQGVTGDVISALCNSVNECTDDYCENVGIPLDLVNRCECQCLPSTSGPHCSRNCANQYDIILVIDASGSIRNERFRSMLEFIIEVVNEFQVGPNLARIGAVVFSETARVEFNLNSYNRLEDVVSAIRNIRYMGRKTNIADALDLVNKEMFLAMDDDRKNVQKNVIIFTDGKPTVKERETMQAAIKLRSNTGAKVTAMGIGLDANLMELTGMASSPVQKMAILAPSFNDVINNQVIRQQILSGIITSTCDEHNECESNPCEKNGVCEDELHRYTCHCQVDWTGQDCQRKCINQMDVAFLLDFSGSVDEVFNVIVAFTEKVIYGLPFAFGRTQVSIVTYEDQGHVAFYLNQYTTKEEVLNALSFRKESGGRTNTQSAMIKTYTNVFTTIHGDRSGVPNIAVVVTDGGSNIQRFNTVPSAMAAKDRGIEMFVAMVGEDPDYGEVNAIASSPDSDHVITLTDATYIDHAADKLLDKLCQ